jgi:hypothetical protein
MNMTRQDPFARSFSDENKNYTAIMDAFSAFSGDTPAPAREACVPTITQLMNATRVEDLPEPSASWTAHEHRCFALRRDALMGSEYIAATGGRVPSYVAAPIEPRLESRTRELTPAQATAVAEREWNDPAIRGTSRNKEWFVMARAAELAGHHTEYTKAGNVATVADPRKPAPTQTLL